MYNLRDRLKELFGIVDKPTFNDSGPVLTVTEREIWDKEWREGRQRFEETWERLLEDPPDLSVLPDVVKDRLVALFANNNYQITLSVGGNRGINADLYFTWRSGSTQTIFQEKDYGTEQFIRMVKAAKEYGRRLEAQRNAALRKLVEEN